MMKAKCEFKHMGPCKEEHKKSEEEKEEEECEEEKKEEEKEKEEEECEEEKEKHKCPDNYKPICSTNGVTFDNMCKLK